ncbi:MAG TPA: hypothetical protein VF339_00205 [Gammaproteobacteria bacterium]
MRTLLPPDWPLLSAIALLFAASLACPALSAGGREFSGLDLLLDGWQGLTRGVYAWLANPLFAAALACAFLARDVAAAALSAAAALVGGTSVFVESALRDSMASVPAIELDVGFALWIVAFAALCLRSLTRAFARRRA